MVKTWLIKENKPDEWNFDGVEIIQGKREISHWLNYTANNKLFIKEININDSKPDVDFLNKLSINLNLSAELETMANTLTIVSRPNYIIQCTYRSDLNAKNSINFNYFSSVVNVESAQIYGGCMFFKIQDKKLVDLELEDILSLIVSFYYIKTYRLKSGKFEEIALNNFEPDINKMFQGYKVKKFKSWLVFSDDSNSNIEQLKQSNNDISQFNNLIWLRIKEYSGDMFEAIQSLNISNNECDLRGIYEDLDIDYITKVFFN